MKSDFDGLKAPVGDGEALIKPPWDRMVEHASRTFHAGLLPLPDAVGTFTEIKLSQPLSELRRWTRARLGLPTEGVPIIAVGHQPDWCHAGVWAKNIAVCRLAEAIGGVAVNIVVDSDAPRSTALAVPSRREGRLRRHRITPNGHTANTPFELLPALSHEDLRSLFREAWGELENLGLPKGVSERFLAGMLRTSTDWVAQMQAGRAAIEADFGMTLADFRMSQSPWGPLLTHLALHAERFAEDYNGALATYRRKKGIRGVMRPMPDLDGTCPRTELPAWVYREGVGRLRLFLERDGSSLTFFGEEHVVGRASCASDGLSAGAAGSIRFEEGWRVRPRALLLTLWVRLFVADYFIHGLGGAKYDEITDDLIQRHFQHVPPPYGCVSATLRLPLGSWEAPKNEIKRLLEHERRLRFNPHRALVGSSARSQKGGGESGGFCNGSNRADLSPATLNLIQERFALEASSRAFQNYEIRNKKHRQELHRRILDVNEQLAPAVQEAIAQTQSRLEAFRMEEEARQVAEDRDSFFGFMDRDKLARLFDAF